MRKFELSPATVCQSDVRHARTGDMYRLWSVVEEGRDGRFHITYSHAPVGEHGQVYYSDAFASADTFSGALEHIESACGMLERAHDIRAT